MSNDQKMQVFPTRMNLTIIKNKLKSAEKGFTLLKRKSDALLKRHREIQQKLESENRNMNKIMEDAFFSLSEAEFFGANLKMYLHECKKSVVDVSVRVEQISGVSLPIFSFNELSINPIVVLEHGGKSLTKCRERFLVALKMLIEIASLKNSFIILDQVLSATNRRVNALECLLIPRLVNTVDYINSELDEQDREEFYRLKKIQKLKKA